MSSNNVDTARAIHNAFNARDWDGLRALLGHECRLDQVSRAQRRGAAVGEYYTRYAAVDDIRCVRGAVPPERPMRHRHDARLRCQPRPVVGWRYYRHQDTCQRAKERQQLIEEFPNSSLKPQANLILSLHSEVDQVTADNKLRDQRIKQLTTELDRLKKIDADRRRRP